MLSLVRMGFQSLLVETRDLKAFESRILCGFDQVPTDFFTAFDKSDETFMLLLLTDRLKATNSLSDIRKTFFVKTQTDAFLSRLLAHPDRDLVTAVRLPPKLILMRLAGESETVIDRIARDLKAARGSLEALMNETSRGTLVAFTEKSLQSPVSLSDLLPEALYVAEEAPPILKHLDHNALKYLNMGRGNRDWNELNIKIYDSYGRFELHYRRLLHVLESLELGLVLGESWGTDAASVLQTVGIYRVRLFTFHDPLEVKRILNGLEYTEDGRRVVDLDLYLQKKKIRWTDLRTPETKEKTAVGALNRRRLLSRLTEEQRLYLRALDREALRKRF